MKGYNRKPIPFENFHHSTPYTVVWDDRKSRVRVLTQSRAFFTSSPNDEGARICNSETGRTFLAVLSPFWLPGKAMESGGRIIQRQSALVVSRTGRQRIPSPKAPPRLLLSCGWRPVVKAAGDLTISRDLISTGIGRAYNKASCFVPSIKISSGPVLCPARLQPRFRDECRRFA